MTIGQPYYEPASNDDETGVEEASPEDTGETEEEHENKWNSDTADADPQWQESGPAKSGEGCSTSGSRPSLSFFLMLLPLIVRRR